MRQKEETYAARRPTMMNFGTRPKGRAVGVEASGNESEQATKDRVFRPHSLLWTAHAKSILPSLASALFFLLIFFLFFFIAIVQRSFASEKWPAGASPANHLFSDRACFSRSPSPPVSEYFSASMSIAYACKQVFRQLTITVVGHREQNSVSIGQEPAKIMESTSGCVRLAD